MDNEMNLDQRIPVPSDEMEKTLKEINAEQQFYSIALFDVLGFSNFVERNGYQAILSLYAKLVELIHEQESSPEGNVGLAGSVAPVPVSTDWKHNQLIANANGYIQVCHFSDTFILFVNYQLSAPGFWLRDSYYEPHPLLAKEPESQFFIPFEQHHHIFISFLQTCMDFFCQSILDGIPLRGVISSGLARMDPFQSIYFGSPLVEAGKGEPAQNALGVSFGRSFNNYHPIYNSFFIPYSKHIKSGDSREHFLSHAVLDWPRYWRKRYKTTDIADSIAKMNLDQHFTHYYDNALVFYDFSLKNADWANEVNCDGTLDIRDFFVRTENWLKEK